jgi:hypothetical protein
MTNSILIALIFSIPSFVSAQANSEMVFVKWEKITIEQIKKPVPEYEYKTVSLGSVTNEYKPVKANPCTLSDSGFHGGFPCNRYREILSY